MIPGLIWLCGVERHGVYLGRVHLTPDAQGQAKMMQGLIQVHGGEWHGINPGIQAWPRQCGAQSWHMNGR